MKRYCLALDLKDDEQLITAYEEHHKKVWPEIIQNIYETGIIDMEIYRTGNRLCMIIETTDDFSFETKAAIDNSNPNVQQWENLMWQYQQAIPFAGKGEKWILMEQIFKLPDNTGTYKS